MSFDPFGLQTVSRQLQGIVNTLNRIEGKVTAMSAELDRLKTSEAALIAKIDEAVSLLHVLKAKIDDLIAGGNDSADLTQLADQTDAALAKLGAEVTADTPPTA